MKVCFGFFFAFLFFGRFASAQDVTDAAVLKIQEIKNDSVRMDSLFHYANKNVDNRPKLAIEIGKILLQDAEAAGSKRNIARSNNLIGEGYEYLSDYPRALKFYLDALSAQEELKLYRSQISSMLSISRIYNSTGDFASQKKYVEGAMAICDRHNDDERVREQRMFVLDYLATIYKKESRYDTAVKLYNEAIGLARQSKDRLQEMSSLCNLAIALKSAKNYAASLAAYDHALSLADTGGNNYPYAVITDNMGILFYQMGELDKGEQYSLKAVSISKKMNYVDVLKDAYENLKNIYQKEKKYADALDYYSKWSDVKDSILDREKSQQIAEWQTKFDMNVKDKQIADQKKEIDYHGKINLLLGVSTTLFLLLGLITYRSYKSQKRSNASISKEKKRSEDLLLNILPSEVAEELKDKGNAAARHFDHVTVMFSDFVNFTRASERMSPEQLIDELHFCFKAFDEIIDKYNIEKIKTIGDSYLAVSGLPVGEPNHAEQITSAAIEINTFMRDRQAALGDKTFAVRIGIHSGSVIAGIVGVKKFSYDIWGDTVNTAARMEQTSEPGKINISQTTYELIKDKFSCEYRGEIEAKNKGWLKMYFVNESKER